MNKKNAVLIKRNFFRLAGVCFAIVWLTVALAAQQKLVAVGGGKRPPAAIKQFVNWAGAEQSKILIITWASGVPQESFDGIKKDFAAYKITSFENAPRISRAIKKLDRRIFYRRRPEPDNGRSRR